MLVTDPPKGIGQQSAAKDDVALQVPQGRDHGRELPHPSLPLSGLEMTESVSAGDEQERPREFHRLSPTRDDALDRPRSPPATEQTILEKTSASKRGRSDGRRPTSPNELPCAEQMRADTGSDGIEDGLAILGMSDLVGDHHVRRHRREPTSPERNAWGTYR